MKGEMAALAAFWGHFYSGHDVLAVGVKEDPHPV